MGTGDGKVRDEGPGGPWGDVSSHSGDVGSYLSEEARVDSGGQGSGVVESGIGGWILRT